MGETVRVYINIEVKTKTPKKVKDDICEILRDRFVHVGEFETIKTEDSKSCSLSFDDTISFAYWGLSYLQELNLPVKYNKYIITADMKLTYIEHAPSEEFNLIVEKEEEY